MKQEIKDPIEIIDTHLEQFFDEDEIIVFHEVDTPDDENHIDVYWIKPKDESVNYSILLTVGMSRIEQNTQPYSNQPKYIELAMLLPKTWNFSNQDWQDDKLWPIRHLKNMAKIPSKKNTWFGFGHSANWSHKNDTMPGTGFNSSVLLNSKVLSDDFVQIKRDEGSIIRVYSAVPLYPEELEFKIKNSANDLIDKFNEFNIDEIVDIKRKTTCAEL